MGVWTGLVKGFDPPILGWPVEGHHGGKARPNQDQAIRARDMCAGVRGG